MGQHLPANAGDSGSNPWLPTSTLARRISQTEKLGRLKPTGMQSQTQLSDQTTSSYKAEPLLPMCSVSPKRWEFFQKLRTPVTTDS